MSLEGIIRRKIFWFNDKRNGGELWKAYTDVSNILNDCSLHNIQVLGERLKRILQHAVDTTEFYKGYDCVDINSFPVINKQMVIEHRNEILSNEYKGQKLHEMHTSGSTGIPFTVQQDRIKRKRVIAEIKAFNDWAGYPSHEKMLFILGAVRKEWHYPRMQEFRENIYRIPMAVNDDASEKRIVDFLIKKKPVALNASACDLYPLVDYIRKYNISADKFSLTTIITGSEMVPEKLRIDLQEVFGDKCRVYVKYSNEEMGILALDSGIGTPYRLNVADYFFEILKMDCDEQAEDGELGRIVITDLFNYALPLIRYDTGDLGIIKKPKGKWPELIDLSGKRRDLLYTTKGDSIGGLAMTNLLKHTKNISMWQVIQETEKDYLYKVVPVEGKSPTDEDILLPDLQNLFGEDANIRVEFSKEIPTISSHKRRYTVNLYKPQ